MAEKETKSPQKAESEAIHELRHSFLLTAAAQTPLSRDSLATYWGPRAAEPVDYIEKNWNEENWVTGAFSSYMTPGTWTSVGQAWQEPVGNVVWAGTESSARWAGYYEGAIQAGMDAARKVNDLITS